MREFILATESNNDMSQDFLQKHNVLVIPHYYTVEEEIFGDGKELTIPQFYEEMRAGKKAGTMASNPAVILEKFTEVAKEGKDILFVSFSSELSGGYNNICVGARTVMEDYPEMQIKVIDTLSASLCEGILLQKAARMREEGKSLEDTAAELEKMVPHLAIQFTVENLDYLFRGGRLSKTSAVLGNMMSLKPILYVTEEGKLVALSKVRGRKKSISTLVDNMEERIGSYQDKQMFIGILHGDCEEDAVYLRDLVKERFGYGDEKFLIRPIGPSIGAHSGPGTLGVAFLADRR